MDYRQREKATEFLVYLAKNLQLLEGLQQSVDADTVAMNELIKIQHEMVNLQNRFSRLVYLSGEVTGE